MYKKTELLSPAGNFEKLKIAFKFGADAVYLGGEAFGLRAGAENFTKDQIAESVALANSLNKSIYVTLNIIARDADLNDILAYARELYEIGVHAAIVADVGVFMMLREALPELDIHISTQANNLNWRTCWFWLENGASRVNLARELSLDEIKLINDNLKMKFGKLPKKPYLEAFVHGAMCMSFSGRCMLSDYMAARSSNRGDCAQPCRWNYSIVERQRPGEYMPVYENERGTFLFNSKDLCMLEYLPQMMDCGIGSLKIEGRMKSEFYTAVTTRAYRIAIDECFKDPEAYAVNTPLKTELMEELLSVSHRDYSAGFYLGKKGEQIYSSSSYMRDSDFIGVARDCFPCGNDDFEVSITLKGAFSEGDELEFVLPDCRAIRKHYVFKMWDENGKPLTRAANAMMTVKLKIPFCVKEGTVIRRKKINV